MIHGMVNLTSSDGLTPQAEVGATYVTKGAHYQYFKASAAIDAYSLCGISDTLTIAEVTAAVLTTTRPGGIAIPQFSVGSGEYCWAPVGPFYLREDNVTPFKVLSKAANADVALYGTGTAGSVDDAVSNPVISGLTLTASQAGTDVATACIAFTRLTVNC